MLNALSRRCSAIECNRVANDDIHDYAGATNQCSRAI